MALTVTRQAGACTTFVLGAGHSPPAVRLDGPHLLAVGWTLARELWPGRVNGAAWLLAPAVAAFPLANLLDWPWALTGTGVLWAVAAGGLLAERWARVAPNAGPTPS